jgi:serine/threonine protein kinase
MNSNHSDEDRTALSGMGGTPRETGEATDSGPSDATVVRGANSAPTINDKAKAGTPDSFGKYELLGEIARGGMGIVYKARQQGLDRLVALKMILGTGITHESAQRFLQEARAAAALDHPNVVPIYDIGETGNSPYFTMALIEGPNLRGFVDSQSALPIATIVTLFAQVVAGVAHAHKHGIIHRDLKPANVLIDKDGRPRVTDFGLAKRSTTDSQLTATGQVVGTPQYMAPEQARDSKDVGPPADVYALGAILYFMLTGRPPFIGESFTDLLLKVVTDNPVPPQQLRADVPAELEVLCLRCLAKSPADRFVDANALAAALAPIADQYLVASSGSIAPALARIGLSRPSAGSLPSLPSGSTEPDLSAPSGSVLANSATATLPTAPPKPNRKPLLIGLGVVAVLLLGVLGYLATRDGKKPDDTAKNDPPPVTPTAVNPTTTPEKPDPGTPISVPKNDGDKLVWPAVSRSDFGLKVDLVAPAAKKDADGTLRFTAGTPMTIHLTAEKDCRVSVWFLDPSGHATRLFPNDDDPDDRLMAGKERTVPGNKKYTLQTTVTEGMGLDRLRVIATTGEPPAFPQGAKLGRFSVFAGADGERLVSAVRGVVIKKATPEKPAGAVAEAELRFRVTK